MNIINFPFPTSKSYLRNQIKEEFESFDNDTLLLKSKTIVDRLIDSDITNFDVFFVYMPIKYEVNIINFIKYLIDNNKTVVIPKIVDDWIMIWVEITSIDNLVVWKFNILEPISESQYHWNIDVILIPGLGFTKYWERLGRGKWYYDRYLESYDMLKVWICYDFQMISYIPVWKYDIRMDMILTENRFIKC